MKDIENRKDIEVIVNNFYEKVRNDDLIGYMFDRVNWDEHLQTMYNFWDNVLFYTGNYSGNPMIKHQMAHQRYPMSKIHFERWIAIFYATVDQIFEGKNATLIKERAKNIATIMELKIIGTIYSLDKE